jgi:molybdate transport system substrate-binding protein
MAAVPSPRRRHVIGLAVTLLACLLPVRDGDAAAKGTVIAAAASLRFALEDILADYARTRPDAAPVRVSYGATGTLVRQIESGAPFAIFLAADDESPQRIAAAKRSAGPPVVFAVGRLSIVVGPGSPVAADADLKDVRRALDDGRLKRFAIANPELAPYGRAAREALQKAGLLDRLGSRLVVGENVGQAAQFVASGAAQAGLVAQSLAIAGTTGARLKAARVPDDWYQPIRQSMVLLAGADAEARHLFAHLQSTRVRAMLTRHGFSAP